MENLKLKKDQANENSVNVIPEIDDIEENESINQEQTYVKVNEEEGRKLFANRKANIALSIVGGIIVFLIVASVILINIDFS